MNLVANGQDPVGDESRKNNEIFKTQLTRARVYINFHEQYGPSSRECECG